MSSVNLIRRIDRCHGIQCLSWHRFGKGNRWCRRIIRRYRTKIV